MSCEARARGRDLVGSAAAPHYTGGQHKARIIKKLNFFLAYQRHQLNLLMLWDCLSLKTIKISPRMLLQQVKVKVTEYTEIEKK